MLTNNVFVYGSLKRTNAAGKHFNTGLLEREGSTFVGPLLVPLPVKMISLGSFPALVPIEDEVYTQIHGELFEVSDDTLRLLDQIEGHPNFYHRVKFPAQLGEAWVYVLPQNRLGGSIHKYEAVANGNW